MIIVLSSLLVLLIAWFGVAVQFPWAVAGLVAILWFFGLAYGRRDRAGSHGLHGW
jgi:hypothetical protein